MSDIADIKPSLVIEFKLQNGELRRLSVRIGDEAGCLTQEEALAEAKRWLDWNVK